jgi:hypothetical protein
MSNSVKANPIDEFLTEIAPAEVEVTLCLDRNLRNLHKIAERDLETALAKPALGKTDAEIETSKERLNAEQIEAAEKVVAIEAEMAEHETVFLLRDISWTDRAVLMALHPPRTVETFTAAGLSAEDAKVASATDRSRGYNTSTLYPALVGKCIASITLPGQKPTPITPEQWEKFAAALEPDQMEQLVWYAVRLVWRQADPKSAAASAILRMRSEVKSKPRASSRSRINGS